jgi:plastocyanin
MTIRISRPLGVALAAMLAALTLRILPAFADGTSVQVHMSNFSFTPKEVTVKAGTTVEWINDGGKHNLRADDGSFKSDDLPKGGKFTHLFDKPGRYQYYCGNHGVKGGKAMAGVVTVN